MEDEMADPFNFIAKESLIRASQVYTLFTTPFARHDPKDDIQVDNDTDKDKDKDKDSDHDMWDQSSDDDDVTHPDDDNDVITITLCSPPPSPAPNDAVSGVSGFESNQLDSLNDVVSDGLGLIGEGKEVRVRDDSVSDSASLPKQLKPCCDTDTISTPIVDVDRPQNDVVSGDLGFQDVEIGGGDTQEVIFGDDTEECDANTEVITENDEEDEVNTRRNSSEEVKECLLYLLRQGNKDGEGDGVVDFLETAKRRGCTFPPPRWKFT